MAHSQSPAETVRFGVFELDLRTRELHKQGIKIRLQEQPLLILQALLERPGEVVTREELRARIWPADTFVDFDHGLYSAMKRLRDVLGDSAESPRFIETLARRGYRFIAPVDAQSKQGPPSSPLPAPEPSPEPKPENEVQPTRFGKRVVWLGSAVLAVILALFLVPNIGRILNWLGLTSTVRHPRSLAVLPLANLSSDSAQDYFADEMTEELITELSKLPDLKVISRTSVMQYKGTRKPLPQIARELGVEAIVEGAVQRSSNRVRITAQLVNGATDQHLWAEEYDRDLSDVLLLQSEVAHDIARKIDLELSPQQKTRIARGVHPVIPQAYDAYLLGRYYWNKRTADGLQRAGDYFQKAIEQDPHFALAYSGLADYYAFLTLLGGPEILRPRDAMPKAKAAATRSVELDDSLAETHASLGHVMHNYDWDWPAAEREFKHAIELNPNYSIVHHWYAHLLMQQGRAQESLAEARRAQELDPLSLFINNGLARQYYLSRQYDQSIAQCRRGLDIDAAYVPARIQLGLALAQKGMLPEAISELERARDQAAGYAVTDKNAVNSSNSASAARVTLPVVHAMLGHVYAIAGRNSDAEQQLQLLRVAARTRYVAQSYFAIVYAALGDKDQAFAWLEKSYQDRSEQMLYLKVEPLVDPLRSDPRFESLLKRVGLDH
jgi:TolB-like protein/DNA-binding winged helix-turn-helix (wHTH) protein/Tfp pilus assembly protein PilF